MAPLAGSSSRWALSSRLPVPAPSSAGGSGWCLRLGYVQTSVPARNVVVALFGTLADAPAPMRASWDKKAFVLKKRRWGPERLFSINLLTVYIMPGVFGDFWLHKGESTESAIVITLSRFEEDRRLCEDITQSPWRFHSRSIQFQIPLRRPTANMLSMTIKIKK